MTVKNGLGRDIGNLDAYVINITVDFTVLDIPDGGYRHLLATATGLNPLLPHRR